MSVPDWSQWIYSELMSMREIDLDEDCDIDEYFDIDRTEIEKNLDYCPRCYGGGCNYCLMCEW